MSTKGTILGIFKKADGLWVSGEKISEKLSISRTAIWKHVQSLRKEGYSIESCRNRGYLLLGSPDILTKEEIQARLKTRVFGKDQIIYFTETDSTNTRAKVLAASNAPEGTIVLAENQTMGKGRKKRSWHSRPHKGIYLSIIMRPSLSLMEAGGMTLLTIVALYESLMPLVQAKAIIKWPNDILINDKKIAGILTEIDAGADQVEYCIIGVGINVNNSAEDFPEELREKATSIALETGREVSRLQLVQNFLETFEYYYNFFQENGLSAIIEKWKNYSDIIGKEVTIGEVNKKHSGTVTDIDNYGRLILIDAKGGTQMIISGDMAPR